jgi:hypothetical protein
MLNQRPITVIKLFSGEAIAKQGTVTSGPIPLSEYAQSRIFSVFYTIAGTGTVKIDYLLGPTKSGTYTAATEIVAAAASGGASALTAFTPSLAPFMKIKLTENNVNPITALDLYLMIQ